MRKDVEKIINEYRISTLFNKKKINRAVEQLRSDETVLYIAPTNAKIYTGSKKKRFPGIFVFTDKRVFVYSKILFNVRMESFNLIDLDSIDSFSNGLTGSKIKLNSNTKSIEVLVSYKSSVATKLIGIFDTAMNNAKNKNNLSHPINEFKSGADEISKFAELLEKGIITNEEFKAKKNQLLGIKS
ncbi:MULTISPECIES: PH domain-containing protein [unclassified Apibacter]|uniref:PH domain-containing protein n=1 Tax=unclassified Apibacter TaxID=2630820 RepID=UPI0021070AB1|nr:MULTISPECIES: PH domain-containing protein [unclassified Apibacter]